MIGLYQLLKLSTLSLLVFSNYCSDNNRTDDSVPMHVASNIAMLL